MTTKLKKNFKIAGIFSFIITALSALLVLCLYLEIEFLLNIYYSAYVLVEGSESLGGFVEFINLYIFIGLLASLVSYWAGSLYYSLSKVPTGAIVHRSGILFFIAILQFCLCLMLFPPISIVPAIMGFVGALMLRNHTKKVLNKALQKIVENESNNESNDESKIILQMANDNDFFINPMVSDIMKEKIELLKKTKANGEITEEQYMIELNKILECKF